MRSSIDQRLHIARLGHRRRGVQCSRQCLVRRREQCVELIEVWICHEARLRRCQPLDATLLHCLVCLHAFLPVIHAPTSVPRSAASAMSGPSRFSRARRAGASTAGRDRDRRRGRDRAALSCRPAARSAPPVLRVVLAIVSISVAGQGGEILSETKSNQFSQGFCGTQAKSEKLDDFPRRLLVAY